MTTNKPEVVAWLHSVRQDSDVITDKVRHVWGTPRGSMGEYTEPLIRLSDYEALRAECEDLRKVLTESRANDQQAMAYLTQIRGLVGGDDFPDMVRRCEKLRKDAERYRHLRDRLTGPTFDNLFFLELYNAGAFDHPDDVDDAVDDAMQEGEHDS